MSRLDALRAATSTELHGRAHPDDLEILTDDPEGWRDALHELVADVDRQIVRNQAALDARAEVETAMVMGEARRRHADWLRTAVAFRCRAERRLATLEHEAAVRRRRRLDDAHHRLATAVRDFLGLLAVRGDGPDVADQALDAVARAYADLEDARAASDTRVLVGADT